MEKSIGSDIETFFPVSLRKLVVMSFCTFGLYQIYWLYQNWRIIKYREQRRISPPWRSVLGIVFLYPIFRRIKRRGLNLGFGALPATALFIVWVLLTLLNYSSAPLLSVLSFGSVFVLVPAQRMANSINQLEDPGLPLNNAFGKLNWVAIVLGGPMFALSVLALLLQHVQT